MTVALSDRARGALDDERSTSRDSAAVAPLSLRPSLSMSSFAPLTIDTKSSHAASAATDPSQPHPHPFTALDIAALHATTPPAAASATRWPAARRGRLGWLGSSSVHGCVVAGFVAVGAVLAALMYVSVQPVMDAGGSSAALLAFSIMFPLVMAAFATFSVLAFHHRTRHAAASPTVASILPPGALSQHKHQALSVLGFFLDRLNNPLHQILSLLQFLQDTQKPISYQQPHPSQPQPQPQQRSADEEEILLSIREQALIMQSILADAFDLRALNPALPPGSLSPSLAQPAGLHWPSLLSALLVPLQEKAVARQVGVVSAVEAGLGIMYGDIRRVQQCVALLLSSVIGLTSEGGSVSVRVKTVKAREERAEEQSEQRRAEAKQECDANSSSEMQRSASLRGVNLSCPTPSPHSKLRRVLRIETDQSKMAHAASPSSVPHRLLTNQLTSSATASSPSTVSSSSTSSSFATFPLAVVPGQPRPTITMQIKVATTTLIKRQQLTQLLHTSHPAATHHATTTSLHTPSPVADASHSLPLVARLSQSLGGSLEVRCDGVRGSGFVLCLSFALTPPLGEGVEVAREMLTSPLPSQSPRGAGWASGEERSEEQYAVVVRSNDDGVEVEDVVAAQRSVSSSRRLTGEEVALAASSLVRSRTTPLNASRRVKADDLASAPAAEQADKQDEPEDNKSIEPTTVNQSVVSSAGTLPSLPLLSFSPFTYAENTPLSAFRASQTPSASPSSAVSSMSSSSFQLHTPSYQLGRSFTEVGTSSSTSTSSPASFAPLGHRHSFNHNTSALYSSPASSATSLLAGSSTSFPASHHSTPVSSSHGRRRGSNGLSSEMTLMTRQVAEARQKLRQSDGALYSGEQAVEEQPLSLLAAPRRLVDRIPTLDMGDGGSELLGGRAVSAPGYSAAQQQQLWQPTEAVSSNSSSPSSPLPLPPERSLTTVRSHTTTVIRATNAPSTSPGPTRVVGSALQATAYPALPANYSLHSPQTSISATLSSSSTSASPSPSHSSSTTLLPTPHPTTTYSATPPLVPRPRPHTARRSPDDDKRFDALRTQLLSLSVLVVDDSDINLKIALRMLQGIECETATDGRQAVEVWRRRAGLNGIVAGAVGTGEEKKGSPQFSATTPPSLVTPPSISSLRSQSAITTSTTASPSRTATTTTSPHLPPFSLILCDIVMPVSGLDATRAIRTLERQHSLPHTPIIAVTANCTRSDRREAKAAGMDLLLAKPFTRQQLFEVMHLAMKDKASGAVGAGVGAGKEVQVGEMSAGGDAGSKRL